MKGKRQRRFWEKKNRSGPRAMQGKRAPWTPKK